MDHQKMLDTAGYYVHEAAMIPLAAYFRKCAAQQLTYFVYSRRIMSWKKITQTLTRQNFIQAAALVCPQEASTYEVM
jgi:hypothetical protein